ncbi:uncharacterized protein B0H18DRAFT_1123055 [Fomitopsis serialis]|uniref:uncharacterized protein n=1 Tax=Fomitopsis serialis TaxID=139415 RepID=UPI00200776B9|nr:uncharacterized protein B0H18DRAFT_1123055 [Neoantrodia serialis]KAH9918447.1 hypothetical protein B0H18DRAFT_1123055 [Neoantrodia serialis]
MTSLKASPALHATTREHPNTKCLRRRPSSVPRTPARAAASGVDIGDALALTARIADTLLMHVPAAKNETLIDFLVRLYSVYVDLHSAYLEIKPLICLDTVDLQAQVADARDLSGVDKPGSQATTSKGKTVFADRGPPMAEAYIQKLDASTGPSLKLTVLNAEGCIWTMVAGGGASVVYSNAIAAHGFAHELANYGEYSRAPSEGQTYEYAKMIIDS